MFLIAIVIDFRDRAREVGNLKAQREFALLSPLSSQGRGQGEGLDPLPLPEGRGRRIDAGGHSLASSPKVPV
jgi:hypothetical protein